MIVYRLCKEDEYSAIFKNSDFSNLGNSFKPWVLNTHKYIEGIKYMHFFAAKDSLFYLSLNQGKYVCIYDIPDDILVMGDGFGYYMDYINFRNMDKVREFALPSLMVRFEYLRTVLKINREIDIEDIENGEDVYSFVETVYDRGKRLKLK